jgi:hypothetical protein
MEKDKEEKFRVPSNSTPIDVELKSLYKKFPIYTTTGSDFDIDKGNDKKIDHPQHYNQGGIECIDAMKEAFGEEAVSHFCICNAFKYLWRHANKEGFDDIRKAIWYLNKYLEIGVINYPENPSENPDKK